MSLTTFDKKNLTAEDYFLIAEAAVIKYAGPSLIIGGIQNNLEREHIIRITASVFMTKHKFQEGGSFVHAVVANDLFAATHRADNTMKRCLSFLAFINNLVSLEEMLYDLEQGMKFETVDR